MEFLEIVEWSVKDFRVGQFAYVTVGSTTSLYLCLQTHTGFVYANNNNEFAETITINGTDYNLWRKISGGSGSSAAFVSASFNSGTNILTLTGGDGSTTNIDLSSLAGGGTGTSGTSGNSGTNGVAGTSGLSYGTSGQDGTSGKDGTSGTSGHDGTNGLGGTAGSSGTAGSTGSSGSSGSAGSSGSSGYGTSGSSGSSGTAGHNGTAGTSGLSYGTSGSDGAAGVAGTAGTSGTSPTGGGSTGVYIIKLEFSAGSLVASPFVLAKDPSGATITSGSGGWTFTKNGANEITITHPLGVWPINFMTHAQLSTGDFMSRMMHGSATTQSVVVQNTAKTTMNFKTLNTTAMGIYGTGTAFAYITFQLPTNDI
jgi:hypothetical protein